MPRLPPVTPFDPGRNAVVQPYDTELQRTDAELRLYDSLATEQVRQDGSLAHYYSLQVGKSKISPLYRETVERVFDGPFALSVYIEWPKNEPVVKEDGLTTTWNTRLWVPRAEIERVRCPTPTEGDVLQVWRTPFFFDWSERGLDEKGGYYFEVTSLQDDGHLFDQPGFVGFELSVARRTQFTPERRIDAKYARPR